MKAQKNGNVHFYCVDPWRGGGECVCQIVYAFKAIFDKNLRSPVNSWEYNLCLNCVLQYHYIGFTFIIFRTAHCTPFWFFVGLLPRRNQKSKSKRCWGQSTCAKHSLSYDNWNRGRRLLKLRTHHHQMKTMILKIQIFSQINTSCLVVFSWLHVI